MKKPPKYMVNLEAYLDEVEKQKKNHEIYDGLADAQEAGATVLDPLLGGIATITNYVRTLDTLPAPDEVQPANRRNAELAKKTLYYYSYQCGLDPFAAAGLSAPAYDLLCDLMHLCHQRGFNFEGMVEAVREDRFKRELEDPEYDRE